MNRNNQGRLPNAAPARLMVIGVVAHLRLRPGLRGVTARSGTEGFNSIMKFLTYKTEEKKAEATAQSRGSWPPSP